MYPSLGPFSRRITLTYDDFDDDDNSVVAKEMLEMDRHNPCTPRNGSMTTRCTTQWPDGNMEFPRIIIALRYIFMYEKVVLPDR